MKCFKLGLVNHSSRKMEDIDAEGDLNCGGLAQEVSEEKNSSKRTKEHSCNILAKNVTAFYPCPKILP